MPSERANVIWRIVAILAVITTIALAIALGVVSHQSKSAGGGSLQSDEPVCRDTGHVPRDPANPAIFDDLTLEEYAIARDFLIKELNLVAFDTVRETQNLVSGYILSIDLHLPKKADALSFLDQGGSKPAREAIAVVIRGELNPPKIEEYIMGPFPNPTYKKLYKNPSYRRDPPYESRFVDDAERFALLKFLEGVGEQLDGVLKESYGAGSVNCAPSDDCLSFYDFAPRLYESGQRTTLFVAFIRGEGYYIRPTNFMVTINHKSQLPSEWAVDTIYYNNKQFSSIENFLTAYTSGGVAKVVAPIDKTTQYYSYKKRDHHSMPERPQMGPRLYEPEGKRYKVTGRHVDYMGWSMHFRSRFQSGLQLMDIRFRGERIAYELSFQEAFVIYSGYDVFETIALYYDASWNMGELAAELMPGVDCPETAMFFDMDYFVNTHKPKRNRRSVCIFEQNANMPLRRHFSTNYYYGYRTYAGLPDYQLVVRQASTIWNYDYVFDYIFHLNGVIEVKAAATGYPEATFYSHEEDDFGHKIFKNAFSNMHIHNFHFKADVDIMGTQNRYENINIDVETVDNPWFPGQKKQMKMRREQIETETQAAYKFNFDEPKYCIFYNKDETNSYGTKRSYRLKPVGMGKFLLPDDLSGLPGASWTKYQLAVTKHSDSELSSTSGYAQHEPWNPVIDFEEYIKNDESLVDEDLVAWVSLATHHIPHSEDAPSTQTPYMTLNFFLYPYNYFDEDPSTSSSDTVFVEPKDNFQRTSIERYGTSTKPVCMPTEYDYKYNGTQYLN